MKSMRTKEEWIEQLDFWLTKHQHLSFLWEGMYLCICVYVCVCNSDAIILFKCNKQNISICVRYLSFQIYITRKLITNTNSCVL